MTRLWIEQPRKSERLRLLALVAALMIAVLLIMVVLAITTSRSSDDGIGSNLGTVHLPLVL
ncbi:MAG: hypothetical protein ABIR32_06010 [Ilumatobacteraceae bacterium]